MAYSSVVGDSQPTAKSVKVTCFPVSYVAAADLADIDADINDAQVSGKAKGAMILADEGSGVFTLYVADGPLADDTWGPVDGGVVVTPA